MKELLLSGHVVPRNIVCNVGNRNNERLREPQLRYKYKYGTYVM